jgi:hypothetical protein
MILESFSIFSIEDFLTKVEIKDLISAFNKIETQTEVEFGKHSVHTSDEYSTKELALAFEPNGRYEINNIPSEVETVLNNALKRNINRIQQIFPEVKRAIPWNFLAYGKNQFCTSHVDYIFKTETKETVFCGIGIMLVPATVGGEFFIETSGSEKYIINREVASDMNYTNKNFKNMKRTKWTVNQKEGTAVIYGAQTIHGTNPVIEGRSKKIISWLSG